MLAENRSALSGFGVQLDLSDSHNLAPSRGALLTHDTLPPATAQLLQAATVVVGGDWRAAMRTQCSASPLHGGASHSPPIRAAAHAPLPLGGGGVSELFGRLLPFAR